MKSFDYHTSIQFLNGFSDEEKLVFEQICREYLLRKNTLGSLPLLFTEIGAWWGTDPACHTQEEIDLVARDGDRTDAQ